MSKQHFMVYCRRRTSQYIGMPRRLGSALNSILCRRVRILCNASCANHNFLLFTPWYSDAVRLRRAQYVIPFIGIVLP